jgi:hypothetical protein
VQAGPPPVLCRDARTDFIALPVTAGGLFVCLFVCLLGCLFGCLFVCLLKYFLACLFIGLSVCLFVCLFVRFQAVAHRHDGATFVSHVPLDTKAVLFAASVAASVASSMPRRCFAPSF